MEQPTRFPVGCVGLAGQTSEQVRISSQSSDHSKFNAEATTPYVDFISFHHWQDAWNWNDNSNIAEAADKPSIRGIWLQHVARARRAFG
jgi:hypothetical protein